MKHKKIILYSIALLLILILINIAYILLNNKNEINNDYALPKGYTMDSYKVEKVFETYCKNSIDCKTPFEYLIQSRCPFVSKCINNQCAVICPDHQAEN
ncbi:MAG: hypothetical protein ACYC3G_02330 [Minisyncoccota bacterium]